MGLKAFGSLKKKFSDSPAPDPVEFQGYYAVRLLTGFLPPLRFFGHRKFFPVDVACPAPGSGGFNEFLNRIRIGCFKIESGDSILGDGQRVLRINYDRPGNPFWLRPLNDELKKTGDGCYLGRGVLRLFGVPFNSFYFSVERENPRRLSSQRPEGDQTADGPSEKQTAASTVKKSAIRGVGAVIFNRVADTMIPRGGVFAAGAADYDLAPRVNAYLDTLTPAIRRLTPVVLYYLEFVSLVFNGRRFTRLPPWRADRFLTRMENGRLLYHRYMVLFLKLLIMTAFYEQEAPAAAIGYVHGCRLLPPEDAA